LDTWLVVNQVNLGTGPVAPQPRFILAHVSKDVTLLDHSSIN